VNSLAVSAYRSRVDADPEWTDRRVPVVWGDPAAGPVGERAMEDYARRGFMTFDELLDADEVVALETELNALARRSGFRTLDQVICEPESDEVRSVFEIHRLSDVFADLARDERLVGPARQILGSDVSVHQSRINLKPGLRGRDFYWHSDFETWHFEDGMPEMRAVSVSISLSENRHDNGSLMIVPGSHHHFIGCVGRTPDRHHEQSLRSQQYGVPDDASLTRLIAEHGIETMLGGPGSAVLFDSNCMHGSNGNITPFPRTNVFIVYNSVENALVEPFGGRAPRPSYIADREGRPVG
jgi:ectoine hydroxylase